MTDKELQKLKRSDLIEILYYLSKENDELREENAKLKERLDQFVNQAIRLTSQEHEALERMAASQAETQTEQVPEETSEHSSGKQ